MVVNYAQCNSVIRDIHFARAGWRHTCIHACTPRNIHKLSGQSRNLQTYTRNIPVMSPWIEASKTLGFENLNVAVPLLPSLARVSLTSGMVFSSTSRMNSILAASRDVRRERSARRSAGAKAAARGAMVARMAADFIVSAVIIMNRWRKWLEAGSGCTCRRRDHIILMLMTRRRHHVLVLDRVGRLRTHVTYVCGTRE